MHDVLIIGAGPAGLSAARWCDELGLDTLVLEQSEEVGGQLLAVHNPIENYLGVRAENGRELRDLFLEQTKDCEFDLWTNVEIKSADLKAKRIVLKSGEELPSIAIILATGLRRRKLGIPGEAEFAGRGLIESSGDRDQFAGGKRLIYFAANYKDPYYSWTAISKPPFLAAVALWPKGDCWGGGGQFAKESKILLNHRENEMTLADGFKLPEFVKVAPFGLRPGWGEDSPIIEERLDRDGWRLVQSGNPIERESGAPLWIEIEPPEIWSKLNPKKGHDYELFALTRGIHERDGAFYVMEHMVVFKKANEKISLGRTDWADWCRSGDLLYSKDGKIFRLGFDGKGFLLPIGDAKLLIDLTDRRFKAKKAPDEARVWNSI